jgi:hypothetical protein
MAGGAKFCKALPFPREQTRPEKHSRKERRMGYLDPKRGEHLFFRETIGPNGEKQKQTTFIGKFVIFMVVLALAGVVIGTITLLVGFVRGL